MIQSDWQPGIISVCFHVSIIDLMREYTRVLSCVVPRCYSEENGKQSVCFTLNKFFFLFKIIIIKFFSTFYWIGQL